MAIAQDMPRGTYRWEARTNLLVPALNAGAGYTPARNGHFSLGVSAIAGYFDLGRSFKGKQGEFVAPCIDFRWAWAVNKGRGRRGGRPTGRRLALRTFRFKQSMPFSRSRPTPKVRSVSAEGRICSQAAQKNGAPSGAPRIGSSL